MTDAIRGTASGKLYPELRLFYKSLKAKQNQTNMVHLIQFLLRGLI